MIERIGKDKVEKVLEDKLLAKGFTNQQSITMAQVFTQNSLEGVYSHGINRFGRFLDYFDAGVVNPEGKPAIKSKFNAVQQWDGNQGPGILNALMAVEAAMHLSNHYGIGCVAMGNTNHWMRGGTYGRMAAKKGYIFIGWTNTIGNLPAWGAVDRKLGNNPLVIGVPGDEPVVIDMAMSQYSYGKLEDLMLKEETLSLPGGYDKEGALSKQPQDILASGRPLPIGYWKGAGLSLVLDILASILSDGLSTAEISQKKIETALSQVFICISPGELGRNRSIAEAIKSILEDYKASIPENEETKIIYPGERTNSIIEENMRLGIPVAKKVWEDILRR